MYSFSKKEKVLIPFLCALGISFVGCGMVNESNPVFFAGLIFVIAAYLLIRRALKASARGKSQEGWPEVMGEGRRLWALDFYGSP